MYLTLFTFFQSCFAFWDQMSKRFKYKFYNQKNNTFLLLFNVKFIWFFFSILLFIFFVEKWKSYKGGPASYDFNELEPNLLRVTFVGLFWRRFLASELHIILKRRNVKICEHSIFLLFKKNMFNGTLQFLSKIEISIKNFGKE